MRPGSISSLVQGVAAAALLATSLAAQAADMPIKARPSYVPMPAYTDWTGFYLGIAGGWAIGNSKHVSDASFGGADISDSYKLSGGIVGGTIGYNYQFSSWVLGVEGDWSWTNKKGSGVDIPPFNTAFVSGTNEKWVATVRARAGYAMASQWLLYATGGLAIGSIEATVTDGAGTTFSETKTRLGWTAGAGVEKILWGNWTAKLEYLYADFGKAGYFNPPPAGNVAVRDDVPVNDHIFRVGVNYKFGGPIGSRF